MEQAKILYGLIEAKPELPSHESPKNLNDTQNNELQDLLILPCNGTQKYSFRNNKWNKD